MAITDSLSHRKGTRRAPAATVAREMGITDAEIAQRLAAVRFTDEDRARVRGLKEIIAGYAGQGTEDFLQYLRAAPAVLPYLRQPAIVDEIRALKRAHIAAMAEGDYGLPYVKIG